MYLVCAGSTPLQAPSQWEAIASPTPMGAIVSLVPMGKRLQAPSQCDAIAKPTPMGGWCKPHPNRMQLQASFNGRQLQAPPCCTRACFSLNPILACPACDGSDSAPAMSCFALPLSLDMLCPTFPTSPALLYLSHQFSAGHTHSNSITLAVADGVKLVSDKPIDDAGLECGDGGYHEAFKEYCLYARRR